MRLIKGIFALTVLLFCNALFAAPPIPPCPPVPHYHVIHHSDDNSRCAYAANDPDPAGLYQPKKCTFLLTDPHYRIISCKYVRELRRCSCVIVRRAQR